MINIKILLAIDNKIIKSKLDKKYGDRVYKYDINCMEDTIEFLNSKENDYIIITRDTLQGFLDKKMYIKKLRLASKNSKIVYIVDNLTQEYKEFLFANEVFNIIEGKNINFNILASYIDNPQNVVYKNVDNVNSLNKKNRIIGIYGSYGTGKSLVSSIIAKNISKLVNGKTLLIDMDIKRPSIDILNNLDNNNKNLYQYINSLDNNINNYLIKQDKLSYLINKPVIKIKFNKDKLNNIYNYVSNNYEYTFIDLSSNEHCEYTKFWLKNLTDIFIVINPNYLSIRKTLEFCKNIKLKNVYIILNCIKSGSLEISQVKSLIPEYKIIGKVYYDKRLESYINGAIPSLEIYSDFDKLYKEFCIEKKGNIKNMYIETYRKFKESIERV